MSDTQCTCISFGPDAVHPGVIMGDCPIHGVPAPTENLLPAPPQTTREFLVAALIEARAPGWMMKKAMRGDYDTFGSPLPHPIGQLVADAHNARLTAIESMARAGDFTASLEEGQAYLEHRTAELAALFNNRRGVDHA